MIPAINYKDMIKELERKYKGQVKTLAILLVRPNNNEISQEILSNITYFHYRSEGKLDIFLPGYGVYVDQSVADAKNVCRVGEDDWSFSTKAYVDFIEALESVSTLKYRGGSELILLDFDKSALSYNTVVRIKLNKAVKDGAIESVETFIEDILGEFVKSGSAYDLSDRMTLSKLGKSIGQELKEKFSLYKVFERTKHFTINNYNK